MQGRPLTPGDTASRAPAGPQNLQGSRASAVVPTPGQGPSRYNEMAGQVPPTSISDVDLSQNIWSPFQPVVPFGPPSVNYPRTFDYPVGFNLDFTGQGRSPFFKMLQVMSRTWGILRAVIETRKDQLMRIPWDIQLIGKPKVKNHPRLDELKKFFRRPDGQNSFASWMRMQLEDKFVIDAANYYVWKDRSGKPLALMHVEGSTIKPLLDDAGRRPEWPNPAYQQIIKGLPWQGLDASEFLYAPQRPTPQEPMFGFSEVQMIYIEILQGIRKMLYKLDYWCYSDDTEVLTRRGWLKFSDTNEDDEFATRHPTTHEFQWQRASSRFDAPYVGEMVSIKNNRTDLLVTPNHRVILSGLPRPLGGHTHRKGETVVLAGDLIGIPITNHGIPLTSKWVGEEVGDKVFGEVEAMDKRLDRDAKIVEMRRSGKEFKEIGARVGVSYHCARETYLFVDAGGVRTKARPGGSPLFHMTGDQFCAFMGMWLAEGSVRRNGVQIAQMQKSKGFVKFKSLLTDIIGHEPFYGGHQFEINHAGFANYLRQFGHALDKFIPDEIMNATPRQIKIFVEYFFLGDGASQSKVLGTSSKRMADQLVELAQKTCCSASMYADDRRERIHVIAGGKPIITTNISYGVRFRQEYSYTKNLKVVRERSYSGRVACVSVPNKSLFVRRNYKASWCGNSEGSIPQLIITVPEGWSPEQLAAFQAHTDFMLAGNLQQKARIRFMPSNSKPFDIKNANGELLKTDEDEWVTRLVCYCFSVSPQPFVKQMNRATAESAAQEAQEEGLHPLMTWAKEELIDPAIQSANLGFGYDDCEFVWLPEPEVDAQKQMTVLTGYGKVGMMTYDEAREQLNLGPLPDGAGKDPIMDTPNGPIPLKETLESNRQKALAVPDQIDREGEKHDMTVESHDASMATQKLSLQQAKQQPPQSGNGKPKPGVGKSADAPFRSGLPGRTLQKKSRGYGADALAQTRGGRPGATPRCEDHS